MESFIIALLKQLYGWTDDTTWLTYNDIQEMLAQAAKETIEELSKELPPIVLRREVEPEDMKVRTILEIEEERVLHLFAEDVTTLRALLMSWDETIPARVGDPLGLPTKLKSGRVVSEVTEELLNEDTPSPTSHSQASGDEK